MQTWDVDSHWGLGRWACTHIHVCLHREAQGSTVQGLTTRL